MMNRNKIATLCLMAGMFFLPLGYDVAQMILLKLTGSLVITTLFFYLLSLSFFGVYMYLSNIDPRRYFKVIKRKISRKIKK
jgi:hypothetical protein